MTTRRFPPRYSGEMLDYSVNFVNRLTPDEEIIAATVAVVDGDVTATSIEYNEGIVQFWLSGGTTAYPVQIVMISVTTNATPQRIIKHLAPISQLG